MENQENNYVDEKIVELRNRFLASQFQDIHGDVYVHGQLIQFIPVVLFEEKMSILLPTDFQDMEDQVIRLKYPTLDRPQIIKTNPENNSDMTFTLIPEEVADEDILANKEAMKNAIKQVHPATVFYEDGLEDLNQTQVGYFTFTSYALGGKLYNLMLVTKVAKQLLVGIFNCANEEKEYWKSFAYQMMMSIEDLTLKGSV